VARGPAGTGGRTLTGLPLGDGAGTPVDVGVSTMLFVLAAMLGFVGAQRLRRRSFLGLPLAVGWGAAGLAVAAVVLALVLPPLIRPVPSTVRPSTAARVVIDSPRPGQVFHGTGDRPAVVPVRVTVPGGRVVAFTSRRLVPNTGHLHLYLDDVLVSMTSAGRQGLRAPPGRHELRVEFVAVDHGPFAPPVVARVAFVVRP
jgi:hypothetical protein